MKPRAEEKALYHGLEERFGVDPRRDKSSRSGLQCGLFDKFLTSHLASLRLETEHATLNAGPEVRRNGKDRSDHVPCTRRFLAGKFRFVVVDRTEKKKKQRRGRQNLLREAI
jgi:hypothetical protein